MDCDALECYAETFETKMYTACKEGDWKSNGIILCTYNDKGEFIVKMEDKTYIVFMQESLDEKRNSIKNK
tara:strand:- start:4653 stop:4862 length:210 start_codon:yes stop_codon:yes gene_type:complete